MSVALQPSNDFYGALKARSGAIEAHYRRLTPSSAALFERAQGVLPGGYTRDAVIGQPYAPFIDHGAGPILVDRDRGPDRGLPRRLRRHRRLVTSAPPPGPDRLPLDGRVAFMTGGGSGIGQAIAARFAAAGRPPAALRRLDSGGAGLLAWRCGDLAVSTAAGLGGRPWR